MFTTKEGKQLAVLHITKVEQASNNAPSLEGIFSNSQGSIKSNFVAFEYEQTNRTLKYKTRSGLVFQVNLANDTVLNGQVVEGKTSYAKDTTFTLTKISPATVTTDSCQSFLGVWEGQWINGNLPPALLFVANVKSDCTATVAANGGQNAQNTKIEDKKFSYLCNSATQGTCVLSMSSSDALSASYSNPSGGRNSAAYKRLVFTE